MRVRPAAVALSEAVKHFVFFLLFVVAVIVLRPEFPQAQNISVRFDASFGAVQTDFGTDARIGAGGADHCRDGAAFKPYNGGSCVLCFDFMSRNAVLRTDGNRLSEQPTHQIDGMYRLVHQRSAPVHGPGAVPAVFIVFLCAVPFNGKGSKCNISEPAAFDGIPDGVHVKVEAVLENHTRFLLGACTRIENALRAFRGEFDRFFDQHMFSRVHGAHGIVPVHAAGQADADDVNCRIGKQRLCIAVKGNLRIFPVQVVQATGVNIADRDQFRIFRGVRGICVRHADSKPQYSVAEFSVFHVLVLP
ncbi:unknown [Clostridium sp. CAG:448]|nr:unknown [Clostridium sp. CAG:448]